MKQLGFYFLYLLENTPEYQIHQYYDVIDDVKDCDSFYSNRS